MSVKGILFDITTHFDKYGYTPLLSKMGLVSVEVVGDAGEEEPDGHPPRSGDLVPLLTEGL